MDEFEDKSFLRIEILLLTMRKIDHITLNQNYDRTVPNNGIVAL